MHAHLFANTCVFVAQRDADAMRQTIWAVEHLVGLPAYRQAVQARHPTVVAADPSPRGVFLGVDFHLTPAGPKLIEINTNAGGALLNGVLLDANHECCADTAPLTTTRAQLEEKITSMFMEEWRAVRGGAPLRTIAIVDDDPGGQYLYPEFELFRDLFERHGFTAFVIDARDLSFENGVLHFQGTPLDLVYNRLTDFYFEDPVHAALRAAYEANAAVITPHPLAHALYADKRNLIDFGNASRLEHWGLPAREAARLARVTPLTVLVTDTNADELWQTRNRWFFKPTHGFGGRGGYRGDKITKRAFAEITKKDYVAQGIAPPATRAVRTHGQRVQLKYDLRHFVYDGRIQLSAARLYQGQTTNFRTQGGGFAPVRISCC
jgi:hypothetical protein